MHPAPTWRLLGLLAVALVLAGLAPVLLERERTVATAQGRAEPLTVVGGPLALIAILVVFPIAGVPLEWTTHLRVSVTADGIGQGLQALPGVVVPYAGINEWVRTVNLLGAAILLLDAALLLAFAPPALGDVRRAGAALPLIALVVVPATLVHPKFPYLQGLLLFALLAFFMWGERVPSDRRGGVLLACAATGAIAMAVAPALDQHSPWINYEALTRGFTPSRVDRFDWTQRYGPLIWPRNGDTVLDVQASPKAFPGEYWKAENLDTFDGVGWAAGGVSTGGGLEGVGARTLDRYTQSLTVTIGKMNTTDVIAAGYTASSPAHLTSVPQPGDSAGTWATSSPLGPGDAYTVSVYAPHPSAALLRKRGRELSGRHRAVGSGGDDAAEPAVGRRRSADGPAPDLRQSWRPAGPDRPDEFHRDLGDPQLAVLAGVHAGSVARAQGEDTVRVPAAGDELPLAVQRVQLQRIPAADRRSAGHVPAPEQARLLPAVCRGNGAAAPDGRDPGPRRDRVHDGHLRPDHETLGRDRRRRARLGRGLVPALRLGHVRPDAGRGPGARRQAPDLVDRFVEQLGRAAAPEPARGLRRRRGGRRYPGRRARARPAWSSR